MSSNSAASRNRATQPTAVAASPKKPSFTDLYTAEFRRAAKFHTSDRTLLVLLEEERNKYLQLEMQYHKILQEVQTLQNNHLSDLRSAEKSHDSESRGLQKALVQKSEECGGAQKELAHWQAKYAKDSASWLATNEKLEAHVARAQKAVRELEGRIKDKESVVADLKRERQAILDATLGKEQEVASAAARRERELVERLGVAERELGGRLSKREEDLRRALALAKERDAQLHDEKERRMRLEVEHLQTVHASKAQADELRSARAEATRRRDDSEQLTAARRELESRVAREQRLLDELGALRAREADLVEKLDGLRGVLRKQMGELERVAGERASEQAALQQTRESEARLRDETAELRRDADANARRQQQLAEENTQLVRELDVATRALGEAKARLGEVGERLTAGAQQQQALREALANQETSGRRERDEAERTRAQLLDEVSRRQQEAAEAQAQLSQLRVQLTSEMGQHAELQTRNKEILLLVQGKIAELQRALGDAQTQLAELRDTESSLRQLLRQRDELVAQQAAKVSELAARLQREQADGEQFRARKQEELQVLHERFAQAKAAMDGEVASLRSALQAKQLQSQSLSDELARVGAELQDASALRVRAESRVADAAAQDANVRRALDSLQGQLAAKNSENAMLALKAQTLAEHIRRQDDEIAAYRQSSAHKDGELGQLQSNVAELTRRLRSQVDILIGGAPAPLSVRRSPSFVAAPPSATTPRPPLGELATSPGNSSVVGLDASIASSVSAASGARQRTTQLVIDGIAEELSKLGIRPLNLRPSVAVPSSPAGGKASSGFDLAAFLHAPSSLALAPQAQSSSGDPTTGA